MILPPWPPSPPLGPPRGTNFSRRNARQPLPPSPAFTVMRTSSLNNTRGSRQNRAGQIEKGGRVPSFGKRRKLILSGDDVDELAHASAIAELDRAGDGRKQRVVLTQADVFARLVTGAALAHDDGSTGDEFAGEHFDAEPLGIGVAAVFRTA